MTNTLKQQLTNLARDEVKWVGAFCANAEGGEPLCVVNEQFSKATQLTHNMECADDCSQKGSTCLGAIEMQKTKSVPSAVVICHCSLEITHCHSTDHLLMLSFELLLWVIGIAMNIDASRNCH